MNDDNDLNKASDLIKKLFDKIVPAEKLEYAHLFDVWEEIAGRDLAAHVTPEDIVHESLILRTDHPGWIQQIRMVQSSIIGKIQKRYPNLGIKNLKIRIGTSEDITD